MKENRGKTMPKSILIMILLSLILLIATLAGACSTTTESPEAKYLVIGAIQALTGASSEAGIRAAHGQEAAAEWVNDNGGITIKGEKYYIKLATADWASNPDGVITAYNKLVYQDKVKFMIGSNFAPIFATTSELAEKDKVLLIQQDGAGNDLGPQATMTFDIVISAATQSKMYDYFLELYPDIKTIAVFYSNEPVGEFDKGLTIKQAEAHGLKVVAEASYDVPTDDYYPMWTKILPAKPDAVTSGMGYSGWKASAMKQARELGFTGPMLETTMSGDVLDILNVFPGGSDFVTPCAYMKDTSNMPPMIEDISKIVKEKYGEEISVDYVSQGWEPMWILIQAIEQAQSLDPVEVKNAFEKTTGFETPFGKGTLGGEQTIGINHVILRPSACYQIMNGEPILIDWFTPELP